MRTIYDLVDPSRVSSPALLYYPEIIRENIVKAIEIAGSPQRLWPHVKTHKLPEIVRMQQAAGIERFKCATIAEAEMLGSCGAREVMVAYPLVGPAVARFLHLMQRFPDCGWWAVGDSQIALDELDNQAGVAGLCPNVLIDANMGMNRTGVPLDELKAFYLAQSARKNLRVRGLHCYDGHLGITDPRERQAKADAAAHTALNIRNEILARGVRLDTVVMGGTPSFPCHTGREDVYFSPGTLFVYDHGYRSKFADLPFVPGAAILARVISRPALRMFTLDLGHKGIGADPPDERGVIVSLPGARPVFHSEEHWVFKLEESATEMPEVGDVLFVIPTHICSTTALYDEVLAVEDGQIAETWRITARGRKITI